jgi:diguanylate cyclase (GGDEF)-like protein
MPLSLSRGNPSSVDPALAGRVLLKRLLQENAALQREVLELRTLRDLSDQDPLTGLGNLRHFDACLAEHLESARQAPSVPGSVVIIEVDRFDEINQRFGHPAGDEALRTVAKHLKRVLRAADVCCRTSDEEFMLILPERDRPAADRVISRLRAALAGCGSQAWWPLEISAGVASWPTHSVEMTGLIHQADSALYEDKVARRSARPPRRLFLVP